MALTGWTAADHREHARLMARKANGFYSGAVNASLKGYPKKADRMFGRSVACGISAKRHYDKAAALEAA